MWFTGIQAGISGTPLPVVTIHTLRSGHIKEHSQHSGVIFAAFKINHLQKSTCYSLSLSQAGTFIKE